MNAFTDIESQGYYESLISEYRHPGTTDARKQYINELLERREERIIEERRISILAKSIIGQLILLYEAITPGVR